MSGPGQALLGLLLAAVGYFMMTSRKIAELGLAGQARVWVFLLGRERAVKLTRYFFGPLAFLAGLVLIAAAVLG